MVSRIWESLSLLYLQEEMKRGRIDSIVKDMRMDVGEAGGIMVPPAFKDSIMQFSAENAIVRPRATVIGA